MNCKICNGNSNLILALDSGYAVSSLGKILTADAEIFLCSKCSHCQTIPSIDLYEYYSKEYKTLSVSFDEDDLYGYENGKLIYRNFHMARTLVAKFKEKFKSNIDEGPILDFGCGKSLVMKHLMQMTQKDDVFLFDVSLDYVKFWDSFVPKNQYSCFDLPVAWNGYFNIVASFFSLEHVSNPIDDLIKIRRLLRNTGYVYVVVPNMYSENVSDMLVIDHIQHYSEPSMNLLFSLCGFEMIEADHDSHSQASIYIGKPVSENSMTKDSMVKNSDDFNVKCLEIASFWNRINSSISNFESEMNDRGVNGYYIIGAGFLGTYIYLQLKCPDRLLGFIDSNIHKQNKGWQNKKVFAPQIVEGDSLKAAFCGFNLVQVRTILPSMTPVGIPATNLWTLERVSI